MYSENKTAQNCRGKTMKKVMLYGLFLFTIPFNGFTKKNLFVNFCENQSTITDTTTIVAATVLTDTCEFIHTHI